MVDAGVDWLTVTAREADVCEAMLGLAEEVASGKRDLGWLTKPAGFQGYRGFGCDECFYGTRQDGACLRVSGGTAHRTATDIAALPVNVSRVDVQITVLLQSDDAECARRLIDDWRLHRRSVDCATQLRSQLNDGGYDGATAYFGTRTAARYTRVYDKHRESRGAYPSGYWRVEVECKRKLALPTFKYVCDGAGLEQRCAGLVAGQLARLGITPLFDVPEVLAGPPQTTSVSDVERKLAWLESTVRPVVRELYELGYHQEASQALYGWLMPSDGLDCAT